MLGDVRLRHLYPGRQLRSWFAVRRDILSVHFYINLDGTYLPIHLPTCNSVYSIAFRAVRSAYSTWRLRLPFLLRSRPLSSSSLICSERQSTAGGMFRPRHIGAMKIAGINRIIVKLFKRLDPTRSLRRRLRLCGCSPFTVARWCSLILRDAGKELGGLRIDPPLS